MQIDRYILDRPEAQRAPLIAQRGGCLGCAECGGLCAPVLELMLVPEAVLGRGRSE